jgi:sugar phosphate isomerase/epimerase
VFTIGSVSLAKSRATYQEMLDFMVAIGCEAIELNGHPSVHQGLWAGETDYTAIKAKLDASGLVATSLGGYCDFAQATDEAVAEQVTQLVEYCQRAHALGIPVVRAFSGDIKEGQSLDTLYPRIVAGFRAVVSEASDLGVKIGIENHGRLINDGDLIYSIIQDVGSPILGTTIDTGNYCWAGNSLDKTCRFFEKLAPATFGVHVKDGRFVDGEFQFVPAGQGDIDLLGLFRQLKAQGYEGGVTSEFEGKTIDLDMGTAMSVAYIKGLRDMLYL